ncbi:MAG: DNA replication and repair protein RecF [Candidatus Eremiobacteraeota bacterium]|nr:DNA replication and repair protein RecF [Candidatus Eremiobacteraeota bacterium]
MRNYGALEFAPAPGLNLFVGNNAQGKSNLLEAIGLLGTGKSFRTARESEIVKRGLPSAAISGDAIVSAGTVRLSCTLALGTSGLRKVYAVNGRKVRYASYLGRVRVVTFVPAHLALISGAPAMRRSLLNAALAQESPAYYAALASYNAFLGQKNALLRSPAAPDPTLLATYDERLVATGTMLILARRALIAALGERAAAVHRSWVGESEGTLELRYACDVPCDVPTSDAVAAAFLTALAAKGAAERARGTSLVGPHRDDLVFTLGGAALAAFGSQGQQRTAVLALKVAEYAVSLARSGEAPLLLLDDVLSELDADRQRAFLQGIGEFGQAFVTTTHPVDIPVAAAYRINAARLAECPAVSRA